MDPLLERASFQRIWRELDEREKAEPDTQLWHRTVWLECCGELLDIEAVRPTSERHPTLGLELAQFGCPRCGRPHQALRFR